MAGDRGEPTVSYICTGRVREVTGWSAETVEKLLMCLRGTNRILDPKFHDSKPWGVSMTWLHYPGPLKGQL